MAGRAQGLKVLSILASPSLQRDDMIDLHRRIAAPTTPGLFREHPIPNLLPGFSIPATALLSKTPALPP